MAATTLPAVLNPDVTLALPTDAVAGLAGFDADGRSAYLVGTLPEVNVWRVIAYHWPEYLFAILLLLAVRASIRVLRRRQLPEHEYCAGCNYDLHRLASATCPECGLSLSPRHNRLAGRYRPRRLLLRLAAVSAVAIGYLAFPFPRTGAFSDWFDWRSPALARAAKRSDREFLKRHVALSHRVFRADLSTGRVETFALLRWAPPPGAFFVSATISRDARTLYCSTGTFEEGGRTLTQIDLATGLPAHEYPVDDYVILPAGGGSGAIVVGRQKRFLRAFDSSSGALLNEALLPVLTHFRQLAHRGDRVVVVLYRTGVRDAGGVAFYTWDPRTDREATHAFDLPMGTSWCLDGEALRSLRRESAWIWIDTRDPATGRVVDTALVRAPGMLADHYVFHAGLLAAEGRLFVTFSGTSRSIAEIDTHARRLRTPVALPTGTYHFFPASPRMIVSQGPWIGTVHSVYTFPRSPAPPPLTRPATPP